MLVGLHDEIGEDGSMSDQDRSEAGVSALGATRVETVFREGPLQALTVETYAPDEADSFDRAHVTFRVEDEDVIATAHLDADGVRGLEKLLGDWRMARVYHAEAAGGFKVWYRSSKNVLHVEIEATKEGAFEECYRMKTCDDSWDYKLVAIEDPDGQLLDLIGEYRQYADDRERRESEADIERLRRSRAGITEEWFIEVRSPESIRRPVRRGRQGTPEEWVRDDDEWVRWYATFSTEASARAKSLEAVTAFGADRVRIVGGPVSGDELYDLSGVAPMPLLMAMLLTGGSIVGESGLCSKVNCVCETIAGWPQKTPLGWAHLHIEKPKVLSDEDFARSMQAHDEVIRRQVEAEYAEREDQSRAELTEKVRDALWANFEAQADRGWVDREGGVIDVGRADGFDMGKAAAAAVDVFMELLSDPLTHSDGHTGIRWS